jgi:hypothetical protein
MKIERIQVDNFLGARSINVQLRTPITMFCGPNAAGKSSIQEAVRMAITGEPVRVSLKKEYGQLVTEGAKAGGALLTVDGGKTYSFDVPGGKVSADEGLPTGLSIALALDGQRFARMPADEKRTFLFNLTGCRATPEEVKKRLIAAKCDEAKIEQILPLLRTGFPAAMEYAKEQALQSKRDWKAETNATYGTSVAERWTAPNPIKPESAAKPDDLAALDVQIAALNQEIGAAAAAIRIANETATKRESLRVKAESVDNKRQLLELKRKELADYEPQVVAMRERASGTARVGLVHDLAYALAEMINLAQDITTPAYVAAVAAMDQYEDAHGELPTETSLDADAKASLPEYERGLEVMQNTVKNLERDVQEAIAAKTAYDELQPADAATASAGDLDAKQQRLTALKASRAQLATMIRAIEDYDAGVKAAEASTKAAAGHHENVTAWLKLADRLAPDGIPGDLLAEALKPLNSTLQIAGIDAQWPQTFISQDMEITAGNRPYALLSESEKWRVDAMIAQAIAKISGYKVLVLDRFDVLDLPGRVQALQWLDMLAEDGTIETALLFATLKAMPSGLSSTISAFWIEGGVVAELKAAA